MVAEPAHNLGLPTDAGSGGVIQFLSLDQGEGHVTVEKRIMDEVDPLLAPCPEELLYLVTPVGKRGGFG
jgi:hypothetical protein